MLGHDFLFLIMGSAGINIQEFSDPVVKSLEKASGRKQ